MKRSEKQDIFMCIIVIDFWVRLDLVYVAIGPGLRIYMQHS